MGFRFRKRVRILHGFALNLSKSGVSLSAGVRGATLNLTARARWGRSLRLEPGPATGLVAIGRPVAVNRASGQRIGAGGRCCYTACGTIREVVLA